MPAASITQAPVADVPALTDVVALNPEPPLASVSLVHESAPGGSLQQPTFLVADAPPRDQASRQESSRRMLTLVGLGGAAVLLMAAALWSRPPQVSALLRDAETPIAITPSHRAPAAVTTLSTPSPAGVAPVLAPPAPSEAGRGDALQAAPAAREATRAVGSGTAAEATPAARQPAASPARTTVAEQRRVPVARPAPPRSPPAPECTPQVDALGLCAPGATVTGR